MSVVSLSTLKTYFQTGDFPTQEQFEDLIDTLGQQNNFRTISKTIGVPGATGVDYNYTSDANKTEQGLEMASIIPGKANIINVLAICIESANGSAGDESSFSMKCGNSSGGTQLFLAANLADVDSIRSTSVATLPQAVFADSSLFFSSTPTTNDWNQFTAGKWKVFISYIDNSLL